MDPEAIAQQLESILGIPGLQVQVVMDDDTLMVVWNRAVGTDLNYPELMPQTVAGLRGMGVNLPPQIDFCSRELGAYDPDWQETYTVPPPLAPPPEPPADSPKVLSDYCFSRNKGLVSAALDNPPPRVAALVWQFHERGLAAQLALAPFLAEFFAAPAKTSPDRLSEEDRWFINDIKSFDDREFRSTSVWLSRYCRDPEATLAQVRAVLQPVTEEMAKPEAAPETPSPRATTARPATPRASRSVAQTSSGCKAKTVPKGFDTAEIGPILGVFAIVSICGWLASGAAGALGPLGTLTVGAGAAAGMGTAIDNTALRGAAVVILIALYVIFSGFLGFLILWVEGLSWLMGLVTGTAAKTIAKQSGTDSLLAPRPLRLLMAGGAAFLLSLAPVVFNFSGVTVGRSGSATGTGAVLATHKATGTITWEGKPFAVRGAAAFWNPNNKEMRISLLPVPITAGDLETLQSLVADEGEERSTNEFPAYGLVEDRPSHDVKQFPRMPAAQLDIRFKPNSPLTTANVLAYNLTAAWPISDSGTQFVGLLCYFGMCQNPKDGLDVALLEPKAGGNLRLTLLPINRPEGLDVSLTVNTKVSVLGS